MTPYSEIDDLFLSDISDDTFFKYDILDREKILNNLRNKAITRFKPCRKDLSLRDDIMQEFTLDLSDEEKNIIATIMRKFWMTDKIFNLNLLKQKMSTKDWKLTSQAEHLLRLTDLSILLEKEISSMIVRYTTYNYSVIKDGKS